jgi:hypothetical protein
MSAEDSIRRTLALYPRRHDTRDVDGYAALFAERGRFVGRNADHVGRDAIRTFIANLYATQPPERQTKHLCANSLIDVQGQTASATTDFVAYERLGDGPWKVHTIGTYVDHLVLEQGEWRFAERRVETGPRSITVP